MLRAERDAEWRLGRSILTAIVWDMANGAKMALTQEALDIVWEWMSLPHVYTDRDIGVLIRQLNAIGETDDSTGVLGDAPAEQAQQPV